jgi:hypothetical protein
VKEDNQLIRVLRAIDRRLGGSIRKSASSRLGGRRVRRGVKVSRVLEGRANSGVVIAPTNDSVGVQAKC